jgi:pyridoxamine 5'-phosphate oxidase
VLFGEWLQTATDAGAKDATAMALATSGPDGVPSVRIVLLKSFDAQGFVWYTDCGSQKGRELQANNQASAVFYWRDFDRQARVTGPVSPVDPDTAREYFASRPLESRFSSAASEQSSPIVDRRVLEDRVQALQEQYPQGDVPMPERWGGYCLEPRSIEFWQGREGRLHDRFLYRRDPSQGDENGWRIERLQP